MKPILLVLAAGMGKIRQGLVLTASGHKADGDPIVGGIIAREQSGIVRLDGQDRAVPPDGKGEGVFFLPVRGFPGGRHHVDLAAVQHGLHLCPGLVVPDVGKVQVGVLGDQVQKFYSVAGQAAAPVFHVVAVEIEDARVHRPAAGRRLRRVRRRQARQEDQKAQQQTQRLASAVCVCCDPQISFFIHTAQSF